MLTRELGILTWDEVFLSLRSTLLPDALRTKYCELFIGKLYSIPQLLSLSPSTGQNSLIYVCIANGVDFENGGSWRSIDFTGIHIAIACMVKTAGQYN